MKFSISKTEFMDAINVVSGYRAKRSTLPILSGIYMSADSGRLVLQTDDLESSVRYVSEALIEEVGETVVSGKLLSEIVKSLPDAAINCSIENNLFHISCMNSSFTLKTMNPSEFPVFPQVELTDSITLPVKQISTMVGKVSKAVSRDESHVILTGINLTVDETHLTMAATDSYRLAISEMEVEGHQGQFNLIIPGTTFKDVCKLASNEDQLIIGYNDSKIVFSFGSSTLVSRKLEGVYPNYKQIIPKEKTVSATINTKDLLNAVNRVSIMAQEYMQIKLLISPDLQQISISSKVADLGDAEEKVDAQIEGDEILIGFNYQYVKEGLTSIESDELIIEANNPMKPGVFKSFDSDNFFYLSMPVKLTN